MFLCTVPRVGQYIESWHVNRGHDAVGILGEYKLGIAVAQGLGLEGQRMVLDKAGQPAGARSWKTW